MNEDARKFGFDAQFQYSNVSNFFDKIGEGHNEISTFRGDFMPFIEEKGIWTDYWSGYYATRPHLKGNILETFCKIQAVKTMFVSAVLKNSSDSLNLKPD